MNFKSAIFYFFIILFISSCGRFENGVNVDSWNPELAAPLAYSSVGVEDILENFNEDGNILIDPDNLIRLIYKSEFYEVGSADVLEIIPSNTFILTDTIRKYVLTNSANLRIDKIKLKEGNLFYQIGWFGGGIVDVNLRVLESYDDEGNSFETDIVVNGLLNQGLIDIRGYEMRPDNDTVTFIYDARKRSDGSKVVFSNTFSLQFQDIVSTFAQGYLGPAPYPSTRDSIAIDIFDFIKEGSISFENPTVQWRVQNSFGFPIRAGVDFLNAVRRDGGVIPLGNLDLQNGVNFNYPSLSEIGQTKETYYEFNAENSNVEDIIGQPIELVDYKVNPWANPDGDETITGFLTDSSSIGFDVTVDLPFYGKANGFTIADTFDFDLTSMDVDIVDHATLKVVSENGFPTDIDVQFYFLNEDNVIFDSLYTPAARVFKAAPIDNNGYVTEKAVAITETYFDSSRWKRLFNNAKSAIAETKVTSLNNGDTSVGIYTDYKMDFRMGMIAGIDPE